MSGIRKLLSDKPVAYYPSLARAVGGIAPALFLQQIAHWQGSDDERWVYRTQEELEQELAMTPKAQATCRKHLVDRGYLEEERRAKNRLHYRVNWDKVEAALQSLPTGESRPAQPESLDLPDGRNSLEESKKESKKEPLTGDADASTPGTFIQFLREELEGADVPVQRSRFDRWGKEFKQLIKRGVPEATLYKACDRIVERWTGDDHRKLTVEQALEDVVNGKPPKHADPEAPKVTATPAAGLEALKAHVTLRRYAYLAEQWDFTQDQPPPFKVEVNLGGDQNERWRIADMMRSVSRRAVHSEQGAA